MRNRQLPALALAGGLLACFSERPSTGPEPPGDGGTDVAIQNFAYVPPTITVVTGATITWTNDDEAPHTVTANDESFESSLLNQGGTYQLVAPAPGTYQYHCEVHPFMAGTLTVTAE